MPPRSAPTFDLMGHYGHERLCYFHDPESSLRAVIAIHSTKLGPALGGIRRWDYPSEAEALDDVLRLSEAMTYKAAVAGLPLGGGKGVILADRSRGRATQAEALAMGRFVETLNGCYIAAEDVGIDTDYIDWMAVETKHAVGGETVSVGGDPSPHTATGVMHGIKASLDYLRLGGSKRGVRVAIQGVGKVGFELAKRVVGAGGEVVACDIHRPSVQRAVDELGVKMIHPEAILTTECDVLAPCALGGAIDAQRVDKLRCRIVCGGANNILSDPERDAVALKKAGILYAPDFVVNAGGLIHLAGHYLGMPQEVFERKIADIESTTLRIFTESEDLPSNYVGALKVAKQQLGTGVSAPLHSG